HSPPRAIHTRPLHAALPISPAGPDPATPIAALWHRFSWRDVHQVRDHGQGLVQGTILKPQRTGPAGQIRQRPEGRLPQPVAIDGDRKSTRLNSSHVKISYAV